MKNEKYITLYKDEFSLDIWAEYMSILGLSYKEREVKILIKDIIAMGDI